MTDRALRLLCLLLVGVLSEPVPGRIPKVYNALITSNQNLEPSKAYPVYQPVLHDAFAYPYQPAVFYGDFPLSNGIPQALLPPRKDAQPSPPPSTSPPENPTEKSPEAPPKSPDPEGSNPQAEASDKNATPAPPLPPNTQSPIPLNEFGLPSQVLPLGRFDPAYNGFTHIGPFTYSYPGFRFYDPYDPFSLSPYANLPPPLYRPLSNVLSQGPPFAPPRVPGPGSAPVPSGPSPGTAPAAPSPAEPNGAPNGAPPSEPSDLNVLNYSSKDPAIPNVPPPPLPSGGLKSDNAE